MCYVMCPCPLPPSGAPGAMRNSPWNVYACCCVLVQLAGLRFSAADEHVAEPCRQMMGCAQMVGRCYGEVTPMPARTGGAQVQPPPPPPLPGTKMFKWSQP